ncbi:MULTISPECIES: hypothetical protein [Tenacibaculum]|uniref:hypothetical protein n=1 Tax=Tenacibaculum TaxID=104267 RepID=UPI001F0AFA6F|nr:MULTISPECIES: hypothetical protein [Tenacibaculum]MCH3882967.1 hypothetical protein [Tenacibaculum aquimarinum]MCH3885464.1 hypothetical protein [Tenacibaculum aquimarinum]MDO6600771.1 hypothetical protein [Tenacibaculum sp. 1_MG-2023]
MPRKFKSGEWVKVKGKLTSPKMQVIKYVPKEDSIFRLVDNDSYLECVWYKNGERKSEVFHQNRLIKMIETGGLLKTFRTNPKLSLTQKLK